MALTIVSRTPNCVTGTYTGTQATHYLDCGFIPSSARAFNATDGDQAWSWMQGMDTAMCMLDATPSSVTSVGVTTLDGSAGNGIGLQLGSNATINETNKVYIAVFNR